MTPDSLAIAVTANASHAFAFTVKNIGTGKATYTLTPSCSAPITCSGSPGTVTVDVGDTALYNVPFTAGASGTGSVQLHAVAGPYSDDGSLTVAIASAGTPSDSIVNSDSLIARDQCFTARLSDAMSYSCGDLQVVHAFPAMTTMGTTRAPLLIYNSQHARPAPLAAATVSVPPGSAAPDTIVATVTLDSVAGRTWVRKWSGTALAAGVAQRFAIPIDSLPAPNGGTPTRIYAYSLDVSACYNGGSCLAATRQRGTLVVVDRSASIYGAGWWIDGLWKIRPVGVIAGASLGFIVGMMQLLKISRTGKSD